MTIKEFAKLCKCNTQTLRYYDRINLLKPENVDSETGYRQYDEEQVLNFVKIKNLQMASFSLGEICFLLTADPVTVDAAFTEKINQQTAVLQQLKKLQKSYQTRHMNEKTKSQAMETMSNYNQEEFGITDAEYREIISRVMEYFDAIGLNYNFEELDGCEYNESDDSSDTKEEYWLNPKDNPEYACVYEKHGWKNVKEFLREIIELDSGEYLFHFEATKEKTANISFCNIVLGMVLNANAFKKMILGCELHDSKDNQNHFWLFKRKK